MFSLPYYPMRPGTIMIGRPVNQVDAVADGADTLKVRGAGLVGGNHRSVTASIPRGQV
jgi:hypothetical protein